MSDLSPRDRELVALGAAMGSNCVPCVEYHVPESQKAGLSGAEIRAAIQHADKKPAADSAASAGCGCS